MKSPEQLKQRGHNKQVVFAEEADYRYYLTTLEEFKDAFGVKVYGFWLMTNHVHLLITPNMELGLGKTMQMLGRYYVQYFNHTYKRTGTLWEGRYKATLIDSERYLLTCYRYIELNPVRAEGMADHPSGYPWSRYRYNALGQEDALVTPHAEYTNLGKTPEERQSAYRALFKARIADKTLTEIREATNRAWVLGSSHFKEQIGRQLNRRAVPLAKGGDRKSEAFNKIKRV